MNQCLVRGKEDHIPLQVFYNLAIFVKGQDAGLKLHKTILMQLNVLWELGGQDIFLQALRLDRFHLGDKPLASFKISVFRWPEVKGSSKWVILKQKFFKDKFHYLFLTLNSDWQGPGRRVRCPPDLRRNSTCCTIHWRWIGDCPWCPISPQTCKPTLMYGLSTRKSLSSSEHRPC